MRPCLTVETPQEPRHKRRAPFRDTEAAHEGARHIVHMIPHFRMHTMFMQKVRQVPTVDTQELREVPPCYPSSWPPTVGFRSRRAAWTACAGGAQRNAAC